MSVAGHHLVRYDGGLLSPTSEVVDGTWSIPVVRELVEIQTRDGVRLVALRKRLEGKTPSAGAIVLLHGLGQNRFSFDLRRRSLANYFVAHGYDVFLAELRGHGLSRAHGAPYPEAFEDYVKQDVPALVRHAAAISQQSRVFLLGHSLGGTLTYCAGPDIQAQLRGIIALAAPAHLGRGAWPLSVLARTLHTARRIGFPAAWRWLPYLSVDLYGSVLLAGLPLFDSPLRVLPFGLWFPRSIEAEVLDERIRSGFDRTGMAVAEFMVRWAATGRLMSSCGTIDYESRFDQLSVPLFCAVGADDAVVPPSSVESGFSRIGSRDKTFRVFGRSGLAKGWGHLDLVCGSSAPRVVWPALLNWISQH